MHDRSKRKSVPPSARGRRPANMANGTTPADFQTNSLLATEFLRQAYAISGNARGSFDLALIWHAAGSPPNRNLEWFYSQKISKPSPIARLAADRDSMAKVEAELQAIHYVISLDPQLEGLSMSMGKAVDTMEDVCAVFMTYPEPAVAVCAIAMLLVYHPPLGVTGVVKYLCDFINIYGRHKTGDALAIETLVARMQRAIRGEADLAA